jgi:hypothetical protein
VASRAHQLLAGEDNSIQHWQDVGDCNVQ